MKLKKITLEKNRETGKFVSICKVGVFHFSKDFITENNFKDGDRIDFFQDEESLKDWYFSISNTGQAPLRSVNSGGKKSSSLKVNCVFMAKKIKQAIGFDIEKTLTVPIGQADIVDGLKIFPIITANIKSTI